jgi:phage terminase large subunit-like protein
MPPPPVCGHTLDGVTCGESGDHFCVPKADHAQKFIEELCVHTKGKFARKPFILEAWQRDEIVRPIFGTLIWSDEHECYVRQYEIVWIEIARKNGKTELLAALMLYLLLGDGEESPEVYGIAVDKEQAGLCFDVAARMAALSKPLAKLIKSTPHNRRMTYAKKNGVYKVSASDAGAALGSNPHGVAADEILAWRNGEMWDALRTGMGSGARKNPMFIAATTAGNDSESFGGLQHAEMQRVAENPARAPHIFVFMRNTPKDADPFDEANWHYANPALGSFLSIEGMRRQAIEAKNDPTKENAFRQFKLNQWVNQAFRWMPLHLYDDNAGDQYPSAEAARDAFDGREAWIGMDLAARQDLTAMCYLFPDGADSCDLLWRFWLPETAFLALDERNDGKLRKWAAAGWLTVTEGDVLDYQRVYQDIEADAKRFTIVGGDADQWSSDPVIQEIQTRTDVEEIFAYKNDFTHMSPGMKRIMDIVKLDGFRHHGNPVARWCFDSVEALSAAYDPEIIRPKKPNRQTQSKRIDAVPAAIMAVNAWTSRGGSEWSTYETEDLLIL